MTYSVKEIFHTLQGEGRRAGRPAVFCRFAGCNLWTGREDDRVEIRPMAALTLTSDHRALDGASAARFLATLKRILEHPGLLLE